MHMNMNRNIKRGETMIPADVTSIIENSIIESNRLEFKKDWNPEKVLHTICAFANNIDNLGGGYIIIGVGEIDGKPMDYVGIDPDSVPRIEKELFRLCNTIAPPYIPEISVETYHDVTLLVIWAHGGESRPYKCPVRIGTKKNDNIEKAFYIRKMSNTVRATREDEVRLFNRCSTPPFDDMVNETASITDIKDWLVRSYLQRVNSDIDFDRTSTLDLYRSLRIVRGPSESLRPVNVGLMMFSEKPERFFPNAHIEVAYIPDATGSGIEEGTFDGPLDFQIRDSLSFIKRYIVEKVVKVPDQAEAIRVFNFPFQAVEETVVNAVYHKDYRIPQPIKVYIRPESLTVFSCPGPDPSITDEMFSEYDLMCEYNLNGRLGDFLKEQKLTEGRNTGIPKVLRSLESNGSEPPIYETDADRRFLRVTIPVHRLFLDRNEPSVMDVPRTGTRKNRNPENTKDAILESLRISGCQSGRELAASVGYSSVNNTFRRCIRELMEDGEIEYLYPDTPTDRRQRICLSRHRVAQKNI